MRRIGTTTGLALLVLAPLTARRAYPAGADLEPGEVRVAQAREGTAVREKPRPLSKALAVAPYGTRVKVLDTETYWVQVAVQAEGGVTGWVRGEELVAPSALTGPGAYGPQSAEKSGPEKVTTADVTAAGRQLLEGNQFDAKTERTLRKMHEDVDAAYPLVDRVENDAPLDADLQVFIRQGMLGGSEQPEEGGRYARLRLQSARGDGAVEVSAPVDDTPLEPTPVTDVDFIERMGKRFSPEQEYWLGRSVAAATIADHGLDPDPKRQALVQRIGATIVRLSERLRGTYGGYHFAVLADKTPNGISGPGGFVFITRGALDLARNEDEVAGILAHEIAHVALKHGEAMMRRSKAFREDMDALRERVIHPQPRPDGCNVCADVAKLLGEGSANLAKSLNVEGYSKEFEFEADWDACLYLCEVGYRSSALAEYLEVMPEREGARWTTHPSSEDRLERLRPIVYRSACAIDCDAGAQARAPRFRVAMGMPARAAPQVPPGSAAPPAAGAPPVPAVRPK